MIPRERTLALVGALSILAGACGSTAPIGPAVAGGQSDQGAGLVAGDDNGLGLEFSDGSPTAAPAADPSDPSFQTDTPSGVPGQPIPTSGASANGDAGASVEPGASGSSTGPSGGSAGAAGALPVAPDTPGVTDTQILIGFVYTENADAANAALGFEEVTRGDQKRYHDLMVEQVNATGGIAGRELVPVFHVLDGASNQSTAESEQQICATWTQDHEVFAGVVGAASDNLRQCLGNAGVGLISVQGMGYSDDRTFADFPYTVEPTNLSLNPMARVMVNGLAAQGFYEPIGAVPTAPKVGVITYDYPTFRRAMDQDLLPALAGLDVDVADPVYVTFPERQSDVGAVSAQLSNAVLRFRSEGVTHVHIFEADGLLTVLFMTNAETQNFRPRYGLNTQNGGQLLVGVVPDGQLRGAQQVGWVPAVDVLDTPMWPARQGCLDLYEAASVQFDSKNAELVGMVFCDMYDSLRRGIENAPGPLSRETLAAGFERLGTSFQSAVVKDVRLESGRRYGVTTYRTSAYDPACSCFSYTGGPFAIR